MSIFDKVKEMLGGEEKSRNVPEQATNAEGTPAQGKDSSGDPLDGLRNTAEDAANSHIDKAAGAADSATRGKYTDHVDTGADKARDAADRIDGQQD
ncbi:antitoxin [Nonomuraea dietziae]|uniref:antitoxin n=1 Tax=Nonomuraea dietziae TaxID=65515 RepID=UPI00343B6F0F